MKKDDNSDIKIEELQQKLDEAVNNWKRALADYKNLENRVALEKQENSKYHTRILLTKLLDVLDLLIAAQKNINDSGLDLVVKKFESLMETEGLKQVLTKDEKFNPETMECLEIINGDKDGIVAEEIAPGYIVGEDILIRPARVKVFKKNEN